MLQYKTGHEGESHCPLLVIKPEVRVFRDSLVLQELDDGVWSDGLERGQ